MRPQHSNESAETSAQPKSIECPGNVWDSTIIEQIEIPGCSSCYAIYEKMSDDSWRIREGMQFPDPHGHGILVPMKQLLWPLPGRPIQHESDEQLYKTVYQFLDYHLECRDRRCYGVMSCFALMTWRIEEFDIIPYLDFLGPKSTGKSRSLELLEQLCYRGWRVTHPTAAVVFYVIDLYHPTLLLDNYEFWPKDTRNEIDGLLNAGYRKGAIVPRRRRNNESGPELVCYNVFSPKALAGTRQLVDSLASRCIIIRMTRSQRDVPMRIDMKWAGELRSQLLCYRFRQFERRKS